MNKAVLLTLLLMVTLPLCAQSDAYLHYSQNPNLDVAFRRHHHPRRHRHLGQRLRHLCLADERILFYPNIY